MAGLNVDQKWVYLKKKHTQNSTTQQKQNIIPKMKHCQFIKKKKTHSKKKQSQFPPQNGSQSLLKQF